MRPVFKYRFIYGLSLMQMFPAISGNSVPQDVVMTVLNNVDRIDLKIAEMFNCCASRDGSVAKVLRLVKTLRMKPYAPRVGLGEGN